MFKTQHGRYKEDIFELVYVFDCIYVYIWFRKPEEYVIRLNNGNLEYIERYLIWVVREYGGCVLWVWG